jgi:hypothetical protein
LPLGPSWEVGFLVAALGVTTTQLWPAYLRDLVGSFQVGAIHGRLLTAWSVAGVAGPLIVNRFLDAQAKPGR